jgi:hypothetical protein
MSGNQPPSSAIPPVGLRLLIPAATGTTFPAITATTAAPPSTVASASSSAAAVRRRVPLVCAGSERQPPNAMTTAAYLFLCLPLLLSLAARGVMPKLLCALSSLFAILLSVEPGGAVLPWALGMIIATVTLFERFRRSPV